MPETPSQQLSLSGSRTVLMCQDFMAVIVLGPVGPSKVDDTMVGGTHMYSLPERFTPRRRTVAPVVSTMLGPDTCSALAAYPA